MFDDTFKMYRDMGMDEAIIDEYKERMNESIDLMTLVMPLVVVLMGLTDTFLTYYVMGRVLPRLGQKMPEFPTFSRWRFSSAFLYFFGFALVGMYWGESRHIDWLYRLSVNVEAAVIFLGFTEGISLIRFFMLRYDVSRWIFYVVFFLIITNGILAQIAAFAGLADMLFDYRRHFDGER